MNKDTKEFVDFIDTLTTAERRELLDFYWGLDKSLELPRNMMYNYSTQEWV